MPITVNYFLFQGYAFDSGDISFGEAESRELILNRGGTINKVNIRKESVTFSLKGATSVDLEAFETERNDNVSNLIAGTAVTQDIDVLGKTIYESLLTNVTPSAPITVNGTTVYESIELEYQSQVWT